MGLSGGPVIKNPPANAGDTGSTHTAGQQSLRGPCSRALVVLQLLKPALLEPALLQ